MGKGIDGCRDALLEGTRSWREAWLRLGQGGHLTAPPTNPTSNTLSSRHKTPLFPLCPPSPILSCLGDHARGVPPAAVLCPRPRGGHPGCPHVPGPVVAAVPAEAWPPHAVPAGRGGRGSSGSPRPAEVQPRGPAAPAEPAPAARLLLPRRARGSLLPCAGGWSTGLGLPRHGGEGTVLPAVWARCCPWYGLGAAVGYGIHSAHGMGTVPAIVWALCCPRCGHSAARDTGTVPPMVWVRCCPWGVGMVLPVE